MAHHNTVLSQLLKMVPRHEFESLAKSIIRADHSVQLPAGRSV